MRLIAREFLICLVILFIIGGLKAYNPKLYPKPASCQSDNDCLKGKAKCVRRECQCNDKYGYGDGKTNCAKWKKCVHNHCEGLGAKYKNSYCLENLRSEMETTCRCESGYFGRPGKPYCAKAAKTGGKYPCLTNRNCPVFAFCNDGHCVCSDELSGDGENCQAPPPEKCSLNNWSCKAKEGRCVEGYCRCDGMYIGNGKFCREALACPEDVKCGNGECKIDPLFPNIPQCECKQGAVKNKKGKCVFKECKVHRDCSLVRKYSICKDFICACEEELILGKASCEPAKPHACVDDKDCHFQAKCLDGECICQGKRTGNGKNCRESEKCTKDCGPGGTCLKEKLLKDDDPVCRCDKGYTKTKDGKCVECFEDVDCNNGICTSKGACKCAKGMVKEGRTCKRAPLHPCNNTRDCHKNARCYGEKCYCSRNTAGNGKFCRVSLQCPTEYVEKCKAVGKNVVQCVVDPWFPNQPECKCHLGYKTSEAGICVEMTECEKNDVVCPPGKVCKKDKNSRYGCACKDGYKEISLAEGNSTCQDIDECSQARPCLAKENSDCENTEGSFKCKCIKGFRMSADRSTCEAYANEICQKGKCTCAPGFARNNSEECEDVDECQDKTLCSAANEECLNDQGIFYCLCRSGYRREDKVCVKEGECKCAQHEVCLEGECKCKKGYKKSTKGYCVPSRKHLDESLGLSLHRNGFPSTLFLCLFGLLAFTE